MKITNQFTFCFVTLVCAGSVQAAINIDATRVSIDSTIGERMSGHTEENFPNYQAPAINSTHVGVLGSNVSPAFNRRNQDLVYRYELPTLSLGESIESFTFSFRITELFDQNATGSKNDHELHVYLLDVVDPTTTGNDLFFRGASDPDHAFVGSQHVTSTTATSQSLALDVEFTIDSGPALTLLQSFYGGDHIPDQDWASFRFNLDRFGVPAFDENGGIMRYQISNDVTTSGFEITAIPEPAAALLGGLGLLALLRRRRS